MSAPDEKTLSAIPAKGSDVPFLADMSDGFRIIYIPELVELIESDAFYDDVPRIESARFYSLRRSAMPSPCTHKHETYSQDECWIYKVMRVYAQTGELIAQHTYVLPNYKMPKV